MTANDWQEKSAKSKEVSFKNTGEKRKLAGYKCIKAEAKMKDGSSFIVYYTPDLIPETKNTIIISKSRMVCLLNMRVDSRKIIISRCHGI